MARSRSVAGGEAPRPPDFFVLQSRNLLKSILLHLHVFECIYQAVLSTLLFELKNFASLETTLCRFCTYNALFSVIDSLLNVKKFKNRGRLFINSLPAAETLVPHLSHYPFKFQRKFKKSYKFT